MKSEQTLSSGPGFWRTVGLLVSVARRRSAGRMSRQRQLFQHRTGSSTDTLGSLSVAFVWIGMAALNSGAVYILHNAIWTGQRYGAEQQGKIVVSQFFNRAIRDLENAKTEKRKREAQVLLEDAYAYEAENRADEFGGSAQEQQAFLRNAVQTHPSSDFMDSDTAQPGIMHLWITGPLPIMLASIVLIWWFVMLTFQGEGLELDLQRRRHPTWEWLFSHPVRPGAVFLAEMLSPFAANPIYATGPLFFGVLYGSIYGMGAGVLATILIGVPVAAATACIGKALEIGIILRFPPRSRGALIGFMSWLGYAAMISFILVGFAMPTVVSTLRRVLEPLAISIPWPLFSWSVGLQSDGSFSFISGMIFCWVVSAVMIFGGVWFTVWGAQRGLAGTDVRPKSKSTKKTSLIPLFGKDPLYRKEILWFLRDRGAIVQTILIPLTIAASQLFNFRGFVQNTELSWHVLSGAAVMFGTYFLWILGPRSLTSEGQALWLAQTWPRGLEELMKAKARLWFLIATALVMIIFVYAMIRFPNQSWRVLLIAVGWMAFGRSMAEKSVTLVSASSSSGEPEPIPKGRRWAASLGMLTFAIGILTQRWQLAVVGIVYSWVTAAAMWQNFRARLPFLFDPWSEKLPPPPTLMHAMIAISVLAEGGAVLTGAFIIVVGEQGIAIAQALSYAIVAIIVWAVASDLLSKRGLKAKQVWCWTTERSSETVKPWWWSGDGTWRGRFWGSLSVGALCGLSLGLLGLIYVTLLSRSETFSEMFRVAQEQMQKVPFLKLSYIVTAVAFAPFAEEYLFRGLLFRALDREWGGWRALVGSAAFFAIYHPPLSWAPVGLLGIATALIFKKTGRLAPAVILHMVYNAVVLTVP